MKNKAEMKFLSFIFSFQIFQAQPGRCVPGALPPGRGRRDGRGQGGPRGQSTHSQSQQIQKQKRQKET